jgi:hypothetical protein
VSKRDVSALVVGLKDLASGLRPDPDAAKSAPRQTKEDEDEDEEDSEDEDEEDSDDDEAALDETRIEQKFLQIVRDIKLTHLETAALRLAIARGDPAIKSALEQFRNELNEAALTRALRDIARATMVATLEGKIRE